MKWLKEFKEFAMRGNVLDMAIGVIIGGAFSAIVSSLVDNIFMPLLGLLTGGLFDISGLAFTVGEVTVTYGAFLNAIVDFILIALCIFLLVKGINVFRRKKEEPPKEEPRLCPFCKTEIHKDATRCPHCTSILTEELQAE